MNDPNNERRKKKTTKKKNRKGNHIELEFDKEEQKIDNFGIQSQIQGKQIDLSLDMTMSMNMDLRKQNLQENISRNANMSDFQKWHPMKFMKKIPNRKVMREFFTSTCKFYCPP